MAAPTITSVTPNLASTGGGSQVQIIGAHLTGATAVHFGTTTATSFVVTSAGVITAKVKAHAAGKVKVSVTTPTGTATQATALTFVAVSTTQRKALMAILLGRFNTPSVLATIYNATGKVVQANLVAVLTAAVGTLFDGYLLEAGAWQKTQWLTSKAVNQAAVTRLNADLATLPTPA